MLENKNKIVVIDVGNLLLGDDGAGIHAVNEIKKSSTTSQTRRVTLYGTFTRRSSPE